MEASAKEERKEEPKKTFIQQLHENVHLAEQGGLLTLLAFEKRYNPYGWNDNHRYEEMRDEVIRSTQSRIAKAKEEYKKKVAPFFLADETPGYTFSRDTQEASINMSRNYFCNQKNRYSRTGPIPCNNGFTVEVTLVKGCDDKNDWGLTKIGLMPDRFPLAKAEKIFSKSNSSAPYRRGRRRARLFGVDPGSDDGRYNLKRARGYRERHGKLPASKRSFTITYDKKAGKVKFSSETFEYWQENLPKNVDFCVCTHMYMSPHEVQIKLLNID